MSRITQRPFVACGSYQNKTLAKNAAARLTESSNQEWKIAKETHSCTDKDGNTETRYAIQRIR